MQTFILDARDQNGQFLGFVAHTPNGLTPDRNFAVRINGRRGVAMLVNDIFSGTRRVSYPRGVVFFPEIF